mmetsp:Transcript_9720/g.20623  ORF Transcript_9720/g.20623 Transcript_9720/m.20623 type:complete len:365 (+) Transcript_9720:263-1357(+)
MPSPPSQTRQRRLRIRLHFHKCGINDFAVASILILLVFSCHGFTPTGTRSGTSSFVTAVIDDSPLEPAQKKDRSKTCLAFNRRDDTTLALTPHHRGGGTTTATATSTALNSTPLSPQLLINTWASIATVTGSFLAFAPVFTTALYGIETEKGTFATYLAEAIGCVMIGHGITLICATVLKTSVQQALGYGILVRLLFLFKSFFINVYDQIDAETGFLSVNTAILSWCALSLLLTGKGNPFVAAKTFSTAALLKASLMFFNPIKASQKFFGIDVGTDDMIQAKALCKSLGLNLLTNAVLMMSLAFNIDPHRSVGISSLVWCVLLGETTFMSKSTALLGSDNHTGSVVAVAYFCFSALLSCLLLAV